MRGRFLAAILVMLCVLIPIASAQGMPHAVIGIVTDSEGTAVMDATVTLTNQRTHESLTVRTDSLGQYQADLSSMPSAYQIGDVVRVEAHAGNLSGTSSVSVTPNAFDQCDITLTNSVIQYDSLWTFLIPFIIVVTIIVTASVGIYLSRKPKLGGENRKGRRRK